MKSFNYIIVNSLWIYHCIVRDKISQFSNSMPLCADWFVFQTESDYTKVTRIDNAFKWFNWKINIWAVLRIPGFAVFRMNAFQYMKSIVFRLSWGIFGIYQPQNITIHWNIHNSHNSWIFPKKNLLLIKFSAWNEKLIHFTIKNATHALNRRFCEKSNYGKNSLCKSLCEVCLKKYVLSFGTTGIF